MLLYTFISCEDKSANFETTPDRISKTTDAKNIRGISLPAGFKYVENADSNYANWLLDLTFRTDRTIYLYNGTPRSNQHIQYAVLNIDIPVYMLSSSDDWRDKKRASEFRNVLDYFVKPLRNVDLDRIIKAMVNEP